MLKSGQTWAGIFATYDSDGSLKAPSSGPTGTLYVDGSSNSATVTITGSNPYKFSVTLPTLTAGQRVDMYITATISGIATAGIVASDQADTAYISNVKSDTADILADTGTDGVLLSVGTGSKQIDLSSGKVLLQPTQTGVTIPTVTNLTNLPTMPTDWITAAGLKADAVTKIQSGLATAAALTVVSGYVDELETRLTAARAGYLDKLNVSGTLANTDNANSFKADVSNLALEATLSAIKGSGWTNETLKAIKEYVDDLESRLTAVRAGYLDNLTKLDANISSRLAASGYTAPDNANILNIKAKTDNLPATPADEATLTAMKGTGWTGIETLKAIKDYVDELETRLTAVRAAYLDKLNVSGTLANTDNASAFKADVSNLALEATLTAIKGSGWTNETLKAIKEYVDDLENRLTAARAGYLDKLDVSGDLANTANADTFKADVSDLALEATLEAIMGTGWINETLVALMEAIEAISTGATPQQIWEYVSRTLTDASDLGLATSEELAEAVADIQGGQGDTLETMTYKINTIDNVVDTIYAEMGSAPEIADAVLDELVTEHAIENSLGDTISDIAAGGGKEEIADAVLDELLADHTIEGSLADGISDILAGGVGSDGSTAEEVWGYANRTLTDASGLGLATEASQNLISNDLNAMPGKVWIHPTRTLTQSGSTVEYPAEGDPLVIYRDTTVLISLTNLGAIGVDDKLWFTVKDSVEEPDENSIIQIDRLGLLYINGAPASQVEDGSITVLDDVLGNVEIKLAQRQAALLPLYEAYPAQWDIKILHSGIVSILNIGTLYIKGTPTRAIL
jgi:ribosome-associated translation inhibitor RaiA